MLKPGEFSRTVPRFPAAPPSSFFLIAQSLRIILLVLLSGSACARPCAPQSEVALWAEENAEIVGGDIAISACPSWFSGYRAGLSYYANGKYLYKGIIGSARLQFGERLSPFAGLGVLVGSAEKENEASADGLDNNGNGLVDEFGENKTVNRISAFLYPEVGVALYTDALGITLSARRYYGSEFSGNVIFSVGISLPFD